MVESQNWLDEAEHKRKLKLLEYEQVQEQKTKELSELRRENAIQEWTQIWARFDAIYAELKKNMDEAQAVKLMKLYLASQAQELNIGSDLLK